MLLLSQHRVTEEHRSPPTARCASQRLNNSLAAHRDTDDEDQLGSRWVSSCSSEDTVSRRLSDGVAVKQLPFPFGCTA
ncbi:hypothetical protein EYF80_036871 [Liparis tanakae]|uniref:Uncharacterized protein n=1 Tax=Liparis tanakae TaxID=230148 RepID=A0A4Z2GJ79_9TELE|nr:hypothetical protein EYF80_036871 [Liparis tanakae]